MQFPDDPAFCQLKYGEGKKCMKVDLLQFCHKPHGEGFSISSSPPRKRKEYDTIIGVESSMMKHSIIRATAIGAKYGIKGLTMYSDVNVPTPEVDESAMTGAVGIVVTLAAVIISLYICAIVIGSFSKTATSNLGLPAAWNTTVTGLDTNAQSSFSLAGIIPIAVIGVGILVIIISAFAMQ